MQFTRDMVQNGSIIENSQGRYYKVIDADSNGGALTVGFIKSRNRWAKSTTWFSYNRDKTFRSIVK